MKKLKQRILIGKVVARSGAAVWAIRLYDEAGLLGAGHSVGGPCYLMGDKPKQ